MPALRQLFTSRRRSYPHRSSEALCNHHHNNTRPPPNLFAELSDSDRIRLPNHDSSAETSSREFPKLMPSMSDVESCRDTRSSLIRLSMVSPPPWTDRKISSAGKLEMSRTSPPPTFMGHNPSPADGLTLSMVVPFSGGHRKTSSADKAYTTNNRRMSMVSPLSVDRPSSPLFAGRAQQLGKFDETGLRHSRMATPEEMMSFGNPAAMGYSCTIEGGTPKGTPKTSPKLPPS